MNCIHVSGFNEYGKDYAAKIIKVIKHFKSNTRDPVIFVPEIDGTGMQALRKQYERLNEVNTRIVTCDALDMAPMDLLNEGWPDEPTWLLSPDDILRIMKESKADGLFDPANFRYPEFFREDMWPAAFDAGFSHHPDALRLEDDRVYGKKLVEGVFLTPRYYHLHDAYDVSSAISYFKGCDKVVVKFNQGNYIDTIAHHQLAHRLPSILLEGELQLEEFIAGEDISLSFIVYDELVLPVCITVEGNRLFPNGGGGKLGTAWARHTMIGPDEMTRYEDPINAMSKIAADLTAAGTPLRGWVDLDFRHNPDKDSYHLIEWMVRGGVSNFITMMHQFAWGYFDVLDAMRRKDFDWLNSRHLLRNPVSTSVELYSINFSLNQPQSYCFPNPYYHGEGTATFDPLERTASCATDGNIYIFGEPASTQRVGVLSMLGDFTAKEEFRMVRSMVENAAWRLPDEQDKEW